MADRKRIELYEHITGEKFAREEAADIAGRINTAVTDWLNARK